MPSTTTDQLRVQERSVHFDIPNYTDDESVVSTPPLAAKTPPFPFAPHTSLSASGSTEDATRDVRDSSAAKDPSFNANEFLAMIGPHIEVVFAEYGPRFLIPTTAER